MIIVYSLPIWLTLIRLIVSPLVLPFIFTQLLPFNSTWLNVLLALLFSCLALTDFFDGYLARKYAQETVLGKILDPIADKFLVYSTLIALLAVHKIAIGWVIIFIGREFFIMGLRHVALEHHFEIPVFYMGKLKTMVQCLMLIFIIINPYQRLGFSSAPYWNGIELMLILLSMFLTVYSAFKYYQFFINHFSRLYFLEHYERHNVRE